MGKHGYGNLRMNSHGLWEGRFSAGYDPVTGKPITIYVVQHKGETKKDVEKRLRRAISDYETGKTRAPGKDTVSSLAEEWLRDYVRPNLKPNTTTDYEKRLNKYILPYLGKKRLTSLQKKDIQNWVNMLRSKQSEWSGAKDGDKLSSKTIINIHTVLSSMLEYAVKLDKIPYNPAQNIILPKKEKVEKNTLPMDLIPTFIFKLKGDPYEYPLKVALWTGMRESEVLGLTWDDVNLESCTILVRHQLQKMNGKGNYIHIDTTKNGKQRLIGIAEFVSDWLREVNIIQEQSKFASYGLWDNQYNLVFTDALGRHLIHTTMRKHFKKIVSELGYPELRVHDLRHTFASIMISQGKDSSSIQSVSHTLGHYSVWFTYDVYGSYLPEQQKKFSDLTQAVGEALTPEFNPRIESNS